MAIRAHGWRTIRDAVRRNIALTRLLERLLADRGLEEACKQQPALVGGINTRDGKLTCRAVAEAHGLKCEPPL